MDITTHLGRLHEDVARATALADDATRETAERLLVAVEPSVRLMLIDALADAAASITAQLDGAVVELGVEGREPVFRIQQGVAPEPLEPTLTLPAEEREPDSDGTARITLRLPEGLKARAESAAEAQRLSLNTWLTDAVRAHLAPTTQPTNTRAAHRVSGWA